MKVILATSNKGKIREIKRILKGSPIEVVEPPEKIEVEEKGGTFLENALLKARAYYEVFGLPALADDSGLVVDALDGYPGVYSSRFWSINFGGLEKGEGQADELNIRKLLRLLKDSYDRRARFIAVVVLYLGKGFLASVGNCEGNIAMEPRGKEGFGYDPVFIPEGFNRTMAELSPEEKDSLSHRAKALRSLLDLITDIQRDLFPSP